MLVSAVRQAGGPVGAIFIAIKTVSGTPRRLRSRSTGGKTSKLQGDVNIFVITSLGFSPSSTIRSTSLLRKYRTGAGSLESDAELWAWPKVTAQLPKRRTAISGHCLQHIIRSPVGE